MAAAGPSIPLPGHLFAVKFDEDDWWHQRVLVWPLSQAAWVIYTPDGDFYCEETVLWESVVLLNDVANRLDAAGRAGTVRFASHRPRDRIFFAHPRT